MAILGQPHRVLLCYCRAIELGIPIDMTLVTVSYAVKRGEKIAKETGFDLDD